MGVIVAALATVALFLTGAWAMGWLETRLAKTGELGPALPVHWHEERVPQEPDPWMYRAAPLVALAGTCLAAVVIPLGPRWIGADLGIGLFYFLVVVDFVVLAVALGGWGADTPGSVEACYRVIAQLIAYVVPLGLAVLGPAMMARSLSTVDIVHAQRDAGLWYGIAQPLGFALYLTAAAMQSYRAPFLEPFADRIAGGVVGVYGGARAVLWRLSLSGLLLLVSAMGAVLFLGGYAGPGHLGPLRMVAKTALVATLVLVLGRKLRARSTAEMLALSWKVLAPLGLLNVLLVGASILLGVGQSPFGGP